MKLENKKVQVAVSAVLFIVLCVNVFHAGCNAGELLYYLLH